MQTLSTSRLELRPLDLGRDLSDLHEMFSDPEWAQGGYDVPSRDLDDSRARLDREFGDNGGWTWAIRVRPDAQAVGVIGLFSDQGSPVRGISWYLRREHWGRGLMSEAARTVVGFVLDQPTVSGVEAWIDSRNHRSIGVARRAGLDLVGRLPRVYDHEVAQSVVMARAAEPSDPPVIGVRPTLLVRDVAATVAILVDAIGLELRFQFGEPEPEFARLGLTRWNDGNGVDVRRHLGGEMPVAVVGLDLGVPIDPVYDAARAAGLVGPRPPAILRGRGGSAPCFSRRVIASCCPALSAHRQQDYVGSSPRGRSTPAEPLSSVRLLGGCHFGGGGCGSAGRRRVTAAGAR